jgi:D-inositol-3-phosphate glycosyltransferase
MDEYYKHHILPTMTDQPRFTIGSYCSSIVWGGLEMNVVRFLVWMRERGWPVVLYANPDTVLAEKARELKIPLRGIRVPSELSALWKARHLCRLIEMDKTRVMIMHQSRDLLVCSMAGRYAGSKLKLIYSQNMHLGNKRDPIHAFQYRRLDAFVAPLPILAEQAKKQTVVPTERIHIIPHGIELDQFTSRENRTESRRKLSLPQDVPILGIIGRLDPKKGQLTGVKALARLRASGHNCHLLIVGNSTLNEGDAYAAAVRNTVKESGLTDYVHFRPHQEQPQVAYGAMDIFALTSQSETYGLVTIEAMASGLPVIGTDSGGTIDIIDHEKTGLRVPFEDDAALASAVARLIDDPIYAARLAAQGKQDALAKYSHHTQCERWESLLRAVVLPVQL